MKDAEPDFTIRTIGTDETLYRGRTNPVLVRVRRLEGWNAPVEVWAENLPPGVRVKPVIAEPKNTPYTGTCGETHYLDGTNIEVQFEVDQDAPLSLSEIRLRGRGVFEGRTVERTARARYFKRRIRHIGDAEEEQLRAVVADAPGVVLDVPRTLTMTKNGEASLTAIVTRLDGGGAPLEVTLETAAEGLSMQPVSVPPASTRADLKLRASATAPGDFLLGRKSEWNCDRQVASCPCTETTMKGLAILAPALCFGAQLSILPPAIQLNGTDATQTFLVSYTDDAGYEHDVTSECVTSNLARASMKKVTVKCRGMQGVGPGCRQSVGATAWGQLRERCQSDLYDVRDARARTVMGRFVVSADLSCLSSGTIRSSTTKPSWAAITSG